MGNDTFVSRRLNLLATHYFVHKIGAKQVNNTFSNYDLPSQ